MLNYYSILGVTRTSTIEDIKRSYRRLALEYHPDQAKGDSKKFLEIKEAYQYLLKNHTHYTPNDYFSKIFKDLFQSMHKENARTHLIRLDIPLMEAFYGTERTLTIKLDIPCGSCTFVTRDHCKACGGVGYIKEEKRGTFFFKDITHQNQTYTYKKYYKNINLQIKLNIKQEKGFYLKNNIVYTDVPLSIFRAIMGDKVTVKTLQREVTVEFSGGNIKDFSRLIPGEGLSGRDLVVNFKLLLQKDLTLLQKNLLKSIINESNKE